jgi:hypothetical protein
MRHTLHFLADDDKGVLLLKEDTLAYGLAHGYERSAAALGVPAGTQVRVELFDDSNHLLDRRTYLVPITQTEAATRIANVA